MAEQGHFINTGGSGNRPGGCLRITQLPEELQCSRDDALAGFVGEPLECAGVAMVILLSLQARACMYNSSTLSGMQVITCIVYR